MSTQEQGAADIVERMEAARDFPNNTCGASRHAQMIAEALIKREPYPMLTEDPEHCGESIAATVEALWRVRSELRAALSERAAPVCGQINSGTPCDMPRNGDERVCPDCNPRGAAPQPATAAVPAQVVRELPRWLAVSAGGGAVRLVPVPPPSCGPDVFVKLNDVRRALTTHPPGEYICTKCGLRQGRTETGEAPF